MHAAGKESSNALGLAGWIRWASGALGWPGYRITNSIAGYRIVSPYIYNNKISAKIGNI